MKNENQHKQCPICFDFLEAKLCTPCDDCGHLADEVENFLVKQRDFTFYSIYENLQLTLCDFCAVDFGSYSADYFGLNKRIAYEHFSFIGDVKPSLQKEKYCSECNKKLKFILFLHKIRTVI